jgi:methionine synthase II (cobalamin-independent)
VTKKTPLTNGPPPFTSRFMKFRDRFIATGIGSFPHHDEGEAVRLIREQFGEAPFWPQLPNRTVREGMVLQYSEGFPCLQKTRKEKGARVEISTESTSEVEAFYERLEAQDWEAFHITRDYAAGFWALMDSMKHSRGEARYLKGQVTGPVTFGLAVLDQEGKPLFYDPTWREILTRHLASKARWMEMRFKTLLPGAETIVFFDEPALSSFGSGFSGLNRDDVLTSLNECLRAVKGLRGVHCCGNTDWSLLLESELDVLSFDAFGYFDTLSLYIDNIRAFLKKGGILAWGIVPAGEEILSIEPEALVDRVRSSIAQLERKGIPRTFLERGIITPSCGVASLPIPIAERVCQVTAEVSRRLAE